VILSFSKPDSSTTTLTQNRLTKNCRPDSERWPSHIVESRCTRWFRFSFRCRPFRCRCLNSWTCVRLHTPLIEPDGLFQASGSRRKAHEVAHGKLRVRLVGRRGPTVCARGLPETSWSPTPTLCAWPTTTDAGSCKRGCPPPIGRADCPETELVWPTQSSYG